MSLEPITTTQLPADGERTHDDAVIAARILAHSQKLGALHADLCRLIDQIDRWNGKSGSAALPAETSSGTDTDACITQQSARIAALTGAVRQLEARLRGLEEMSLVAPRKPMQIRLIELLIGPEYYRPWWRRAAVPGVTIVIPAASRSDDAAAAATVRSVSRQYQAGWEAVVVGPDPGEKLRQAIADSAGRARHVREEAPEWECLAKGLGSAARDSASGVFGIIHPGQQLAPAAADTVMRFFRDHPRVAVARFDRIVRRGAWRAALPREKQMDVYTLLAAPAIRGSEHGGLFIRRTALGMVGGIKPAMRSAAEWHLHLRLARMFGIRRAAGQVLSIAADDAVREPSGEPLEFEQARQEFLSNFGMAGRARCRLIHIFHVAIHCLESRRGQPPISLPAGALDCDAIETAPECPLSGAPADRLLFTIPDEIGRPYWVYRCQAGIAALIRPAAPGYNDPPPDQSPSALPPATSFASDDSLLAARFAHVDPNNPALRALTTTGSENGDRLAAQTKWSVTRLPANTSLADAALMLPQEQRFEVIWAGSAIQEFPDPAGLLRALRSVLAPGGIVAFAAPNLDSRLRRRFGSAWAGWHVLRHRLILGRRGVRELARLSDLRIMSMRSHTDLATVMVALVSERANASPPESAERLVRRANRFWDWRGEGEQWLVVMKAE